MIWQILSFAPVFFFLESEDPDKDINLYINSPGGSITAGLAIYDTMNYIKPDIVTICVGQAASMAAVLLAAGKAGKRFALPNARVMIHQPLAAHRDRLLISRSMQKRSCRCARPSIKYLVMPPARP